MIAALISWLSRDTSKHEDRRRALATIHDVAALAGVSIKTVSRVINGEKYVRAQLRQRVEGAIETLAYRPRQAARTMGGRRSHLIAFLCQSTTISYVARLELGASLRCRELDQYLVVETVPDRTSDVSDVARRLLGALNPDGMILPPPFADNEALLHLLHQAQVPVVRVGGTHRADGHHVFVDERAAARAMVQHLIGLGHRSIGLVKGHPHHRSASERLEGFHAAMAEAGLSVEETLLAQGSFNMRSGVEAGQFLLSGKRRPSAIFALNDQMALGVMIAAQKLGISIPQDLSLAGFDDEPMSQHLWPSLTTIRQPVEAIGTRAVDILTEHPHGEACLLELPFELIPRESCAVPSA